MSSKLTWGTPNAWETLIADASGLANGASVESTVYSGVEQFIDIGLHIRTTGAVSNAGVIEIYILQDVDGSDETSSAPKKMPLVAVAIESTTNAQIIAVQGVQVPPGPFKFLLVNRSSGTLTAVAAENKMLIRSYSPEGQ
jgi:hypothetical protein